MPSVRGTLEVVEGPYIGPECRLDYVWFRYIAAAMKRVQIVHWRLEWAQLVPCLVRASARGVSISIFSTNIHPLLLKDQLDTRFVANHSHVFQPSRAKGKSSMFHYKIVLIDDEIVLLGSCNKFAKSILEDSEDLVVLRSRELNHQIPQCAKITSSFLAVLPRPNRGLPDWSLEVEFTVSVLLRLWLSRPFKIYFF